MLPILVWPAQGGRCSKVFNRALVIFVIKSRVLVRAVSITCWKPTSTQNNTKRKLNENLDSIPSWLTRLSDCFAINILCGACDCDKEFTRAVDHLHHLETVHYRKNQQMLSNWTYCARLRMQKIPGSERSKQGAQEYTLFKVLYSWKSWQQTPRRYWLCLEAAAN